ncbi:ParB/RepB/Spo0J family partition protein [Eubacterium callanderi]|uniref:ParB/RepB/Spo0J family partition protein n=1 Tax=Eubacterium callanderi TaxID=53442 RepID=UPI0022E276DF|nr:ParB/RepB/Spo0J family partition protein [Eubacterium callanderi]
MAANKKINMPLPSADDLFKTDAERQNDGLEKIMEIPIEEISSFPDHPFKLQMDEAMQDMVESIKEYGVLSPALVRPKEGGGYEMVSGHRRKMASEIAEKTVIPCIVRNLTDDEATILMVDSNLQRENILPSEKAYAYKMKLEALKHQGKKMDETSRPVVGKSESAEIVGKESGDSGRQIQRYIRLTELDSPILDMVDEGRIAFRPAVELSYLKPAEQKQLLEVMESEECTPSLTQSTKLKQFSKEGKLTNNVILSIMKEVKPNQKETIKIKKEKISKYFRKGTTDKKIEDTIIKALELYQKRQKQMER